MICVLSDGDLMHHLSTLIGFGLGFVSGETGVAVDGFASPPTAAGLAMVARQVLCFTVVYPQFLL